jgi:type IV secretion system protein VirB4
MSLGPVALSFVGASGKEDLKRIRALKSEHGRDWPIRWLETRGVHDAASLLKYG